MKTVLWVLGLLVAFCVAPAVAHPHVFADATVKVFFDEKGFAGVKNHWVFDEIYSAAMIPSGDSNGDGNISGAENDWFLKMIMEPLLEKNYFNYVQYGSSFLKVRKLKNFKASVKNNRLVLDFDTEFFLPVSDDYEMLVLVVSDPTNYIQMKTDMENADVDAPDAIDVEYFNDGLKGLSLFRSFVAGGEGLFLRFKKK